MEIRLNLALLAALALLWAGLTANDPVAALDPEASEARELAALEDDFANDRSDIVLARRLSALYLELDRPGLAVAALRSADPELLEDPMLMHRLAQAYEQSGRMLDALATSQLALARCGRSLGTADSSAATPLPAYECGAREYTRLDMHRSALSHMVRWGVADPATDPRTPMAYDVAMRRATVASVR
jgi:predicted Zn-dependent protease